MSVYMRPSAMQTGVGFTCPICDKPKTLSNAVKDPELRCPNCDYCMIHKIKDIGKFSLLIECPRCKAILYFSTARLKPKTNGNGKGNVHVKVRNKFSIALGCKNCGLYTEVRVMEALPWVVKSDEKGEHEITL